MTKELIRAENLTKYFPVTKGLIMMKTVGHVQAVDDINFSINEGETLDWWVSRAAERPPRPS